MRPGFRHEQAAVLGEAGEQHVGEIARGRLPAGGDVAHGGCLSVAPRCQRRCAQISRGVVHAPPPDRRARPSPKAPARWSPAPSPAASPAWPRRATPRPVVPGVSAAAGTATALDRRQREFAAARPGSQIAAVAGLQRRALRLAAAAFQHQQPAPAQPFGDAQMHIDVGGDGTRHRRRTARPAGFEQARHGVDGRAQPEQAAHAQQPRPARGTSPAAADRRSGPPQRAASAPIGGGRRPSAAQRPARFDAARKIVRAVHQHAHAGPGKRQRGQQEPRRAAACGRRRRTANRAPTARSSSGMPACGARRLTRPAISSASSPRKRSSIRKAPT